MSKRLSPPVGMLGMLGILGMHGILGILGVLYIQRCVTDPCCLSQVCL